MIPVGFAKGEVVGAGIPKAFDNLNPPAPPPLPPALPDAPPPPPPATTT